MITFSYAGEVSLLVPGLSATGATVVSFGIAVLFALSLLAHELGHVATCLGLGLRVRRVVIFLLGGVSEIEGEPRGPAEEYLVAVAGPLTTLLLTGLFSVGAMVTPERTIAWAVLVILAVSNLVVAVFNLLPGLPLDGGQLLRSAVWRVTGSRLTGTKAAAWSGRLLAALIMAVGVLLAILPERNLVAAAASLMLATLLTIFIWAGARQAVVAATITDRLPQLQLVNLIRPSLLVPAELPIAEALRRAWQSRAQGLIVIDTTGRPTAVVSEARVMAVPEQQRPWITVADVAEQLRPELLIAHTATGPELFERMRSSQAMEHVVVDAGGAPLGVVTSADLARLIQHWQDGPAAYPVQLGQPR